MRRVIGATLVILATLAGLVLLWQFRDALILFVFSLALAAAMRPIIDYWIERGMNRALAILLTYLMGVIVVAVLLLLVLGPLLTELEQATNNLSDAYQQIIKTWPSGSSFQQAIAARLPPTDTLLTGITGQEGLLLAQTVLGVAQTFLGLVSQLAIVVVLSIYWSVDRVHFERLWLSLLSARERTRAREIWRSIEKGVGAYIRSELVQSLLAGFLLWGSYKLLGLPYAALLALTGALLWLIPWLGAVLAVILPVSIGLLTSPGIAALAALLTLLVLLALEVVVEPRMFNRRRYSSLLVVIMVVAMADLFGLFGLIIAPPLAAAIQILFTNLVRTSSPSNTVAPEIQVANLQVQLDRLRELVNAMEQEAPPEIVSLMNRLAVLVDETSQYVETAEQEPATLKLPIQPRSSIGTG